MTFANLIAAANRDPSAAFHIFAEYDDGKRGYYASRATLEEAKRLGRKLKGSVIWDRDGEFVA
jgi:hypothetical protein